MAEAFHVRGSTPGRALMVLALFASTTLGQTARPASPPRQPAPPPAPAVTPARPAPESVSRRVEDDIALLDRISNAMASVARIAKPSVVSIQTLTQSRNRSMRASGSGVILDTRGHIVTSYHVIENVSQVDVTLADGRRFRATVVGSDPKTDVAVLRINNATNLVPARFGDSSRVEVGHMVLAIGSPFMLAQTVTHGIVSATGRGDLDIEGIDYQSFIQTDAPTNPGNSGGALVNTRGEVIGINTAIATGSGQFSGVAFATPSNTVLWAARGLISGRPLVRGYLGVAIRSLPSELATRYGLTSTEGVVIDDVTPDSPAQRAGLRRDDIILEIDGKSVIDRAQFRMMIAELPPGSRHTLTILRGGERRNLSVTLAQQPDDF